MMRVLIGGVVGAVAAAAGWMAIEHATRQEFGWLAVAVGLITGIVVHKLAGVGSRGSYARGALAAVLALVVCVGSRQVYAKIMTKTNAAGAPIAVVKSADGTNDAESEMSGKLEEIESPVISYEDLGVSSAGKVSDLSIKPGLSQWDMLWLSLSALAAYLVGKGRDEIVSRDDGEENAEPSDTADAEQ